MMKQVDMEKAALVGGAVLVVSTLFLIQKHTTPHPRRTGLRPEGGVTLQAAAPGAHARAVSGQRSASHSRSRATSSHRTRRDPHVSTSVPGLSTKPKPPAAAPASVPQAPPSTDRTPTPTAPVPVTPLTATALQEHRQREGRVKAVEEHLEGAAAHMQAGLEHFATVSNAATTGTNQIGDGDATEVRASSSLPLSRVPLDGAKLIEPDNTTTTVMKDADAVIERDSQGHKHTARPKSSWKHATDATDGTEAARAASKEHRPAPPLSAAAVTDTATHGDASPPERSHSFLHLSDLGFSPITPANHSGTAENDNNNNKRNTPEAAAHPRSLTSHPTLPAPLGTLAKLEAAVDTLVQQVVHAKGSSVSWMALYVLVRQLPQSARTVLSASSGRSKWHGALARVLASLPALTDASVRSLAATAMTLLEAESVDPDADRHYEWASPRATTAVELKAGSELSEAQRSWCLLLPSASATSLVAAPDDASQCESPTRFAACQVESVASSSSDVARDAAESKHARHVDADLLTALSEKYHYLVQQPQAIAAPTSHRAFSDVAQTLSFLRELKETPAFAQLRRQPEYAVFACDFVDAVGQLQHAVDLHDHATELATPSGNGPSVCLPATERKSSAHGASRAVELHAGTAPSFNLSADGPQNAGGTPDCQPLASASSRVRASSRVGSDGLRSPLEPRKPRTYYRALSTSAVAQEPVSPPTSRTVPAKTSGRFERSRTDYSSPLAQNSSGALKVSTQPGAPDSNVFDGLYTPPKASPTKHSVKAPFQLYA